MSDHGSRARYIAGCRCKPCKRAHRDYMRPYMRVWQRERRAAAKQKRLDSEIEQE